jgi:hypothetical protein
MIKPYKHIFAQILLIIGIAFGQFSKDLTIHSYIDDNLYRSPEPVQDMLSSIKLGLSYQDTESNIRLYNNTNLILYKNTSGRNFLINNFGINKSLQISEKLNSNFNLGGNWTLRINKDDYNYYNYSQLSGYANFQILSEQDSFSTIGTSSHGHGRRTGGTTTTTNTISEQLSTSQVNVVLRLTQSLHEKAGIYFQYRKQISIDDSTSYRNFDDYYQDDELFDDPFTYESDSYSSQLTIMLPKSTKLLIGGSLSSKNYISEPAYSTEEDTMGIGKLRFDDQTNYFIDLSKTFNINKDWANSIKFNLYYSYTNNESNSYWYNYKNTSWGGGIQWSF